MSFYSRHELEELGFAFLGDGLRISRKTSFYRSDRISIGSNSRIDDFCVLSAGEGGIAIGRHVHIATFCSISGSAAISLDDFSGLSARSIVCSSSDETRGMVLNIPIMPAAFGRREDLPVRIGRHAIVGSGAIILPGTTIGEGAVVGALSLASGDLPAFTVYAGNPAVAIRPRDREFLALAERIEPSDA